MLMLTDMVLHSLYASGVGFSLHQFDPSCSYRVEEPPGLVELQTNEWDPVMNWIEQR